MTAALTIFFMLMFWHALADFPLQGDYLANNKVNNAWLLTMHCLIHAGGVFVITNSLVLALVELISHAAIDTLKCRGKISFFLDQALHVVFKIWFVAALVYTPELLR